MKFLFSIWILFSFYNFAQTADEIICRVQTKFDKIENLNADFTQEISSAHSLNSMKFSGKFFFQKEKSFRIELPKRVIISDGESIWNYDERENKVVISDVTDDEISFSLNEIIYTYPNNCELALIAKDKNGYSIRAVPKNAELGFKEAIIRINTNFILTKISIIDFNDMEYSFELLSIKLNKSLSTKIFEFNPTNEVEVIDLR